MKNLNLKLKGEDSKVSIKGDIGDVGMLIVKEMRKNNSFKSFLLSCVATEDIMGDLIDVFRSIDSDSESK